MIGQEDTSERSVEVKEGTGDTPPAVGLGEVIDLPGTADDPSRRSSATDGEGDFIDLERGVTNDELETRVEEHVDEHRSEGEGSDEGSEGSDQGDDARDEAAVAMERLEGEATHRLVLDDQRTIDVELGRIAHRRRKASGSE